MGRRAGLLAFIRHFIAQFDERLAPGLNLGDAGVCYSFLDRSTWQSCRALA